MSSISDGCPLPVPLQFAAGILIQGRALLLLGLPVRATILGLGVLPNLTVEAVNLTVALRTGPVAMAF